jgi:branched-chain amino acid transport system substrate-binding protein
MSKSPLSRRAALKLAGAGALGLAAPAIAQADPLRIGMIVTYTGPYADYGRQMDNGMGVWLARRNGLVGGRKVAFVKRDTAGAAPDLAIRIAREFATRDKVDIVMGLDFSPNAIAVAPTLTQAKLPCLVLNAAASVIPGRSPYIARLSFTVGQVSAPMGTWAARQGIKTAITLVSDYSSGHDAEKAFASTFVAGGGTLVNALRVPLANPDFAPFVQRIRDEKPDAAFFFFPAGDHPTAFLKTARERGLPDAGIKLIATGEAMDDTYMQATGDAGLGLITTHHYSTAHESALNRGFVADYRAAYGDYPPNYMAMTAWDGLNVLDTALATNGGKTDGDALIDAIKGLRIESPRGPIEIAAATRDIVQTVYVRKTERVDGKLACVEFDKFERVADPLA